VHGHWIRYWSLFSSLILLTSHSFLPYTIAIPLPPSFLPSSPRSEFEERLDLFVLAFPAFSAITGQPHPYTLEGLAYRYRMESENPEHPN
jgi:hypothetical protein